MANRARSFPLPAFLLIPAAALCLLAFQTDGERGASLLRDRVEAHGGLERFRSIRDWSILAERNLLTDGSTTKEIYQEYLLREEGRVQTLLIKIRGDSRLVYGHDGELGFALNDGELRSDRGAAGEAYYRAHGEYYLRALPFKWMDPGMKVTDAGEEAGDRLLRITTGEGVGRAWKDVWIASFDGGTGLLKEARLTHDRSMETWMDPPQSGLTEIRYRYSDYRNLDGLMFPFRMEYYSGGRKTGENVIREMEWNRGVDRALFRVEAHLSDRAR